MSAQHTQGRLTVFVDPRQGSGTTAFEQYAEGNNGAQFDINIVDQRGGLVATVPAAGKSGYSKVRAHDQARRLVACWNACVGVEADMIEAAGDGLLAKALRQVGEKHEAMRLAEAQRDDLLKVATSVMDWWKEHQYDTSRIDEEEYNLFDTEPEFVVASRAAIAKVKGGAA